MESVRFESRFDYTITVDANINQLLDHIPPLTIQPFVENAIIHGLIPIQNKKGDLKISLQKIEQKIICIIEDNGIGREKAMAIKEAKMQSHESMGIAITKERLRIYNLSEKNTASMELSIQDKFDEFGNASGTIVTLALPFQALKT
jgi:two-component system LytT family sensor kinase